MQIIRDEENNRVKYVLLFEAELCEKLNVTADQLRSWRELMPPLEERMHPDRERMEPVYKVTIDQLALYDKYAKILKTGMSVQQVRELERRDAKAAEEGKNLKHLEMYALLAEEAPPGVSAHALRSYCVVFLYQNRGGKMLLPKELAKVANISEETAKRHLRILQMVGALRLAQNPTRWEFAFVPKALSKYYPR